MASPPGRSGISTSTVNSGRRGASNPSTQSQKANVRVVPFEPQQHTIGVDGKDFQGYQPSGGEPYVGRLRAGATTSVGL